MSNGLTGALSRAGRDRRGAIEPGEAGFGEAPDVTDLDDDLCRCPWGDAHEPGERRPRLLESLASLLVMALSCSITSRSMATRCSISRSRSDTVGSVTPEISSPPSEFTRAWTVLIAGS